MPDEGYDTVHAAYVAILDRHPEASEKGKKNRYTSLNGHMSSFLSPAGELCIRLSADDMQAFHKEYPGDPVMQYGAVMKGYVELPQSLWRDTDAALDWFNKSWTYVGGLKPK